MAAKSVSPSPDGRTSCKIPAEYAEDFRAAVAIEVAIQAGRARSDHKKAIGRSAFGEPNEAARARSDMQHSMWLLTADAALFGKVGHEGVEELNITVPDHETAESIAAAFETMARDVIGRRIKEGLSYSPVPTDLAEEGARLTWTVERAAEWSTLALSMRDVEKVA
jgi:hypothetical protein